MSAQEILKCRLGELEPDSTQPRSLFSEESLLGLAKTLASGQLQPIVAYRRKDKLIILDGERRWRAAKVAELPTVDVVVVEEPKEKGALLLQQLIANLQREDLSPLERANAIDRLMKETGWTAAKAGAALGLSAPTVS